MPSPSAPLLVLVSFVLVAAVGSPASIDAGPPIDAGPDVPALDAIRAIW